MKQNTVDLKVYKRIILTKKKKRLIPADGLGVYSFDQKTNDYIY